MAARPAAGSPQPPASGVPVVVCGGVVTADLIQVVDHTPGRNEKMVADSQRLEVGGPAANAARTVVALGCAARLIAPYGNGPLTGFVREQLSADGVEWIDPLAGEPNRSPLSSVLVHAGTGERSVVFGGAATWEPRRADDPVVQEWLSGAGAVLIDGHGGGLPATLAAAAHTRGVPVVLDGGSHKVGMADYFLHVTLALLSADFEPPAGGDPLAWALAAGAADAARSAEADPIVWRTAYGDKEIPVPSVTAIDTLAAGDVLHGAAAAALAVTGGDRRLLGEVLAFAGAVASESVRFAGAIGWTADASVVSALRERLGRLAHR